jgi:hypothetical protein
MKSPTENIDFQTTILSRFDLIFIVRDIQDEKRDQELAKHIINVHRKQDAFRSEQKDAGSLIDIERLKKCSLPALSLVGALSSPSSLLLFLLPCPLQVHCLRSPESGTASLRGRECCFLGLFCCCWLAYY